MKRLVMALVGFLLASVLTGRAADPAEKAPTASGESLSGWEYVLTVPLPEKGPAGGRYEFTVPPVVLDHSNLAALGKEREPYPGRFDGKQEVKTMPVDVPGGAAGYRREGLNDLRLFDARGKEVPHDLRVRRAINAQHLLDDKQLDARRDRVTLDLGADARHNSIEIPTSGSNFRRKVLIEGSDNNKDWSVIRESQLLSFRVDHQSLEVRLFKYEQSSRRYVRVTVFPDPSLTKDEPVLEKVKVFQSVQVPAVETENTAEVGPRQAVRTDLGPGSAWALSFGNLTVPCDRVTIDAKEREFARPYQLQLATGGGNYQVLAVGEWRREARSAPRPLEVRFNETLARKLRLVITDSRNAPLTLGEVRYSAPAREVIFPAADPNTGEKYEGPFKLYFGKPEAEAPIYDFASHLPAKIEPEPTPIDLNNAEARKNPDYQAPALPWTERYPWLVYVVLGAASVVLLAVLFLLARQALNRTEPTPVPVT